MRGAKGIILSVLKEELPVIAEGKLNNISDKIVKELGLSRNMYINLNEIKGKPYKPYKH